MNKETKLALRVDTAGSWDLDGNIVALDESDRIIDIKQGRALKRNWRQEDGATLHLHDPPNQAPNQKWRVEVVRNR